MALCKMLVREGADVDVANTKLETPLMLAAAHGHMALVDVLTPRCDARSLDVQGQSALLWVCRNALLDTAAMKRRVRALLARGADINAATKQGESPLFALVGNGCVETCVFLIEAGARVNVSLRTGDTPLLLASRLGLERHVELLLDSGAAIDSTNSEGDSALSLCAQTGTTAAFAELLDWGADVNVANHKGMTPLMQACVNNLPGIVELLRQRSRVSGLTVNLEARSIPGGNTALHFAAELRRESCVKALVKTGADPSAVNDAGDTPLMLAARHGHVSIAQRLIAAHAAVDSHNKDGETPLSIVSDNYCFQIEKLLRARGAVDRGAKRRRVTAQ